MPLTERLTKTLGDHVKDIKAILAEHELSEDVKAAIAKAVTENYRTKAEVDSKAERIKALEDQNKALTEQVEALEGDGEKLDELRKQVEDFKAAEEQRKADAEESERRESFKAVFDTALNGREFANDLVRDTVFEKVYSECQKSAGTGADKALEDVVRDLDGIWQNPHNDPKRMPNGDGLGGENPSDRGKKSAMREIAGFMFK